MFKSVSTMIPAVDLQRALTFYTDVLELEKVRDDEGLATVKCPDGTLIHIYERAATKADHNSGMFLVDDIESVVKELRSRDVQFEELDMPDRGIKTVGGIAELSGTRGAWFKDTEGNTFMIAQFAKG